MEALLAMARQAHRDSQEYVRLAGQSRRQRDQAIRRLHASGSLGYGKIAEQVGVSRDMIAKICQRPSTK